MSSSLLHSLFGTESKFGEPRPIPATLRALYARWLRESSALREAEVAMAAASGREKAAKVELLHALSKVDAEATGSTRVRCGEDGTYRIETTDAEAAPKRPEPPAWVAEELAKIERDERNAERDE